MTNRTDPLIIAVAPNGAYKSQDDHANLPIAPRELANTAAACAEAGAAMIHLHVRDNYGKHSLDPAHYQSAISAIKKSVGDRLSIQVTSEAAGRYNASEQIAVIRELRPRSVSIALREIVPPESNTPEALEFLAWLSKEEILPQYILYSAEDVTRYQQLLAQGVVPDTPHWVLFVLGRYSQNQQSQPEQVVPFLKNYGNSKVPWAVCAFGQTEFDCVEFAASHGGHVRVGFENNLYLKDGQLAKNNTALIEQIALAETARNTPLADATTFREKFNGWG